MAHITVNGWPVGAGSPVTVVIGAGQPAASTRAAERLVTELTGKLPVTVTDPADETTTVAAGNEAACATATPRLTPDQQLVEALADAYRAALASETVATRNAAVYQKLRDALRGTIEAAWGQPAVKARALVEAVADDPRPVWAIFYDRQGVPLAIAS